MADTTSLESFLNDVADSIRAKTGKTEEILAENFDTEISSIDTVNNQSKTTTPATTEVVVEPDEGYTGLSSVTVSAVDNTIDNNITVENIKSNVTILGVTGTVEELNAQDKIANPSVEIQTISPDENYNALNSVVINAVDSTIDDNITAENIKSGVTILGVTGTSEEINSQTKTVTPTTEIQTVTPDEEYNSLSSVTVNAVDSSIDENIVAENIKSGTTILGITGTVEELNGEEVSITPSTEIQTITPDEGYNAITAATVNAVDATIDENITAGNIKKDVTILGVTGTAVTGWDASQLTSMYYMFYYYPETSLDLSNFDASNVTNMAYTFGYSSLIELNLLNFDTSSVTNMQYMFASCKSLTSLDLSNFNTSNVTTMSHMFYNCTGLTSLNVSSFNTSNVTIMSWIFASCEALTSLDVSNFDTSNVTDMSYMFYGCKALTSLDVSNLDTSNVTAMNRMFGYLYKLTSLDLSTLNTSNVTNMAGMFAYFSSSTTCPELDLSNFDTSNVTDMSDMFQNSNIASLDLSSFNTSKVTTMSSMFQGCGRLTSLDLTNFTNTNVTTMYMMFHGCSGLTSLDLSKFTGVTSTTSTSSTGSSTARSVAYMFYGCSKLITLDISGLSWRHTTKYAFYGCTALETVYVKDSTSKTACDTALSAAGLSITSTIKE